MRKLVIVFFVSLLFGCSDDYFESTSSDVFFYPVECNGSPVDYGNIKVYENCDTVNDELELSDFVCSIDIDIEYCIMDEFNGLNYVYHTTLKSGNYYVSVYSDVTKNKGVHEMYLKGTCEVKACNQ